MIRLPHITGRTDAEKIEQIVKFLRELTEEVQRLQAKEAETEQKTSSGQ